MRLANTLPGQALFSQLEAVLRQMLAIEDMLLVRLNTHKLEKVYPATPHQSDEFISGLCHSTSNIEVSKESLFLAQHAAAPATTVFRPLHHQHVRPIGGR